MGVARARQIVTRAGEESRRLGRDLQWSDSNRDIAAYGRPRGVQAVLSHDDSDLDDTQAEYVFEQMRSKTSEVIEGKYRNPASRIRLCVGTRL